MIESVIHLVLRGAGFLFNSVLDVATLKDVKWIKNEKILYDEEGLTICRQRPGKPAMCTADVRLTVTTHRIFIHESAKPSSAHVLVLDLDMEETEENPFVSRLPGVERGRLRKRAVRCNAERSALLLEPYDLGWKLRNDILLEIFSGRVEEICRVLKNDHSV